MGKKVPKGRSGNLLEREDAKGNTPLLLAAGTGTCTAAIGTRNTSMCRDSLTNNRRHPRKQVPSSNNNAHMKGEKGCTGEKGAEVKLGAIQEQR